MGPRTHKTVTDFAGAALRLAEVVALTDGLNIPSRAISFG